MPRYSEDGARIPELFAEIRKRAGGWINLRMMTSGRFRASGWDNRCVATGSTPNEALARLLLMVSNAQP